MQTHTRILSLSLSHTHTQTYTNIQTDRHILSSISCKSNLVVKRIVCTLSHSYNEENSPVERKKYISRKACLNFGYLFIYLFIWGRCNQCCVVKRIVCTLSHPQDTHWVSLSHTHTNIHKHTDRQKHTESLSHTHDSLIHSSVLTTNSLMGRKTKYLLYRSLL